VIGGEVHVKLDGPQRAVASLKPGDAVVLPAGTGHKCETSSDDFQMTGAYPSGQQWDLCTGKLGERPKVLENIRQLALPKQDPLYGKLGVLGEL
jgi:uncharacterized protein YjlB